ncbi:MAG: DUF1343 domain-containing protein [Ignavibacteria bacterium]|nr:DUF1343 domain-containing protein [Ignavibacteria bacterium]
MKKKIFIFIIFIYSISIGQNQKVLLGIDILEKDKFSILTGKRVGLVTNHTGVNSKLISTIELFSQAKNFDLISVFSPEHGARGFNSAGESVDDYVDTITGIKYYSLYGKRQKPTKDQMKEIDILVYDIQDIGCRAYTYISTLGLAMEAAAENKKQFLVLDRPNPLGGLRIEGNLVEEKFVSFVSPFKIPYVYGLTSGELAILLNEEKMLHNGVKCKLNVIKMNGWERWMRFEDTGLLWVPTSSNVPYNITPSYLVGTGVLGELITISIGISYTLPFQVYAAEWINSDSLSHHLNKLNLGGVIFRPITFKTNYGQWLDKILHGSQVHITDFDQVSLLELQFYFMQVHNELYPDKKIFNLADSSRIKMFDKVLGTDQIRNLFTNRYKVEDIKEYLSKDVKTFREMSKKYYLYN